MNCTALRLSEFHRNEKKISKHTLTIREDCKGKAINYFSQQLEHLCTGTQMNPLEERLSNDKHGDVVC